MQVAVRGTNVDITPALQEYAESKIGRLTRYFAEPDCEVQVKLSVQKNVQSAEATIRVQGITMRAEEKGKDMYASIDLVEEKLERQIRKYRTRLDKRHRRQGGVSKLFADLQDERLGEILADDEPKIVREKRFVLKPMDVEEAILQMNLVDHDFYLFRNIDSGQTEVVYRRSDGTYGLIAT